MTPSAPTVTNDIPKMSMLENAARFCLVLLGLASFFLLTVGVQEIPDLPQEHALIGMLVLFWMGVYGYFAVYSGISRKRRTVYRGLLVSLVNLSLLFYLLNF